MHVYQKGNLANTPAWTIPISQHLMHVVLKQILPTFNDGKWNTSVLWEYVRTKNEIILSLLGGIIMLRGVASELAWTTYLVRGVRTSYT